MIIQTLTKKSPYSSPWVKPFIIILCILYLGFTSIGFIALVFPKFLPIIFGLLQ
jgi:hypothetical protein